ncbi:MAG: hypothetical protein HY430_00390 [Candidatus Levybacteria bacterium]|nr:hypothetical protein [Candidatus Levybacteria bacterium]
MLLMAALAWYPGLSLLKFAVILIAASFRS